MAEWWNQTPVYEFEEPVYGSRPPRERRSAAQAPRINTYDEHLTSSSTFDLGVEARRPARSPRPRVRRRNSYPPNPRVEDEHVALARELDGRHHSVAVEKIHDPPARGEIDQHPILYESELSASEAATTAPLDTILVSNQRRPEGRGKGQEEWEVAQRKRQEEERNAERRFVLLPKSDTHSPVREDRDPYADDNELDYYADSRKPETPKVRQERRSSPPRSPGPDMGRRRSRQDLPSLKTDVADHANAPPPLERSPNAYAYAPKIIEDLRAPARNGLLSPDVGSARPRSRGGDGYFDQPRDRDRRSRPGTPSGASRPSTPNLTRASSDFTARSPSALNPDTAYGRSRRDRDGGSRPTSPHTSRPSTPSGHRRQGSKDERYDDFERPKKAYSNPVPTPSGGPSGIDKRRVDTFPSVSDSRSPRPISRPVSPFQDPGYPRPYDTREVTTTRTARDHSPPPTASMPAMPPPTWPPVFAPPPRANTHLDPPSMGSYRRLSHDISGGHIAPLPPCPRTSPIHGAYDWLTLPRCGDFHICPTCYVSNVENTSFRSFFAPAPFQPSTSGIVCDFGTQPWYRIAWLMVLKNREKDLSLIYRLAEILRRHAQGDSECLGGGEAVREWYGVVDPKTGRVLGGWGVCGCCKEVLEAVLPQLQGVFVRREQSDVMAGYGSDREREKGYTSDRSASSGGTGIAARKGICAMRFDTSAFIHYFDALELVAEQTPRHLGRYLPDMALFIDVVKRLKPPATTPATSTTTPECAGSKELPNAPWFVIAQLPELTVCPACFQSVVKPEVLNRRAIPRMFEVEVRPRGSCQLYSERMRRVFRECCEGDEFVRLARASRERRERERVWREDVGFAERWGEEKREREVEMAGRRWRVWE